MKAIIGFLSLITLVSVLFAMDESPANGTIYARENGRYYYYDSKNSKPNREPASIDLNKKKEDKTQTEKTKKDQNSILRYYNNDHSPYLWHKN